MGAGSEESKQLEAVLLEMVKRSSELEEKVESLEEQMRGMEEQRASLTSLAKAHLELLDSMTESLKPYASSLKTWSGRWNEHASAQRETFGTFKEQVDELGKKNLELGKTSTKVNKQLEGLKIRWVVIPTLVVLAGAVLWIKVHEPEERSAKSLELEEQGKYYQERVGKLGEDERKRLLERLNHPEGTRELVFAPEPPKPKKTKARSKSKKPGRKRN